MTTERETQDITIAGHSFVLKTYATARETQAIQQTYFKGAKVEVAGDQPKISDFNPSVQFDVQQEMIRQMVVSMDASPDNIVDRCLELPSDLYEELVAQIDALVSKKKK